MKKKKEENPCYVYAGYYGGACVYVGEGRYKRWNHLNSGTSHIYQANAMHFSGKTIDIEVVEGTFSKKSARVLEAKMIEELQPLWNVINTEADQLRRTLKKLSREFVENRKTNKFKFLLDVSDLIMANGQVLLTHTHCQTSPNHILYHYDLGDKFLNTILDSAERSERGKYIFQMSDEFLQNPRRYYRTPK